MGTLTRHTPRFGPHQWMVHLRGTWGTFFLENQWTLELSDSQGNIELRIIQKSHLLQVCLYFSFFRGGVSTFTDGSYTYHPCTKQRQPGVFSRRSTSNPRCCPSFGKSRGEGWWCPTVRQADWGNNRFPDDFWSVTQKSSPKQITLWLMFSPGG